MPVIQHRVKFDYVLERIDGVVMDPTEVKSMQFWKGANSGVYTSLVGTVDYPVNYIVAGFDDTVEWHVTAKTVDYQGRVSAFAAPEVVIPRGPEVPKPPVDGVVLSA